MCDVSLDDHEHEHEKETNKLLSARFLNKTTAELRFQHPLDKNTLPTIEISKDKMKWIPHNMTKNGNLANIDTGYKYVMIQDTEDILTILNVTQEATSNGSFCTYKNITRKLHEEFHDGCASFCICQESGVKCLKYECPTYFGVDILDPNCVEWETFPKNFTANPPNCCPEKLVCKSNGSCDYDGKTYQNWQQVPENITGCEKRCFCEMGKIECQNICPPVPALPPANLRCSQHEAILAHLEDEPCCLYWMCNQQEQEKHPGMSFLLMFLF